MIDLKTFTFSKSSINALLECPKSFYYGYVKKEKSKPSKAAMKGARLHKIFEKLNKGEACVEAMFPADKVHVQNYVKWLKESGLDLPVHAETKLAMDYADLHFTGIIDAVFLRGDRALLIDYKTGRESGSLADYRFELQLYSLMAEKAYNCTVYTYGILFTGTGLFLFEKNDHRYEEVQIKLQEVKKLVAKDLTAAPSLDKCQRCFFRDYCEVIKNPALQ